MKSEKSLYVHELNFHMYLSANVLFSTEIFFILFGPWRHQPSALNPQHHLPSLHGDDALLVPPIRFSWHTNVGEYKEESQIFSAETSSSHTLFLFQIKTSHWTIIIIMKKNYFNLFTWLCELGHYGCWSLHCKFWM